MIKLALTDDHTLVRKGLVAILEELGYDCVLDTDNGEELIAHLPEVEPDVVLMDYAMPEMDGVEVTTYLTENFPDIKVLALTMNDDDLSIIRMIKAGARGYILKGATPAELQLAIDEVHEKGYHYTERVTGSISNSLYHEKSTQTIFEKEHITPREQEFLQWSCTELSYKEIADKMNVSPLTVDGYRESLFEKLNMRSRIGLVLFAIKNELVQI
jgi:DNA-binding NarL/FixJ family response regulator